MPSSSVVVLFGISEKSWANAANSHHISVLALITCHCTIEHSTAECSTFVERTNVRGRHTHVQYRTVSTQPFISVRNQLHILAQIQSHHQAGYENKSGKKYTVAWVSDLQPNNIMSRNTHNINTNTASGINSQGYKNCMFKF
jgi:hypothetical protein